MNNMVSDKAVDAVFRGFRYVFRYKSLEVQLNSETEKLKIEMNNMSNEVKKEKANGKLIKAHVSKWQKEVEEEIQKSATTELPPSSCNCIKSLPIPNPVSRFQRGRNAFKKATAVAQLTSTGKDHLTRDIADLSPFQNKPKPDTAYEEFESRKDVYKKLWDALVNEDSPLIHGIYGMAGVGKTRMMENFWEDALKDKIFKDVVRVDVGSENIDNLKLQDQVAGLVNCNLESQDVNRRASQLESSIRNVGKILLILDDVWSEIPLDDIIGTPFGDGSNSKGSKILFTSRKEDVLKGNKCEHLVEINTLSPGEALNLFKNTVGADKINSLQDESLVQRVCDECGHLPLLIHAVGKALKDKPHNSWKDAHHQLETGKFQNIVGVEPKVYKCIKLSIDYLQHDDAKSCLFLCSFFPEDAIIDLKMLVQLATGSKLINPDGGESRVLNMVNSLKTSSLLLGPGPKVHDIIRDVARSMASTDPTYAFLHVKCNSQYFPSDAGCCTGKLLRLDMETSDVYFDEDMVCKDLHTLWLQSNNHPQKFSGGFFKMFAYLSSLMLQNVKISLEQFSLQDLGNLRTVTFLGCDISKTNASLFPAKLKSLWIYDCYLPRPLKVANLTCLQKLKIQNINLLVVPNFISTLSSLEELHIPEGFHIDGEEYQEEPIVMEISKLTHLRSLQFSFPVGSTFHGTNALSNYIVSYDILVGGPGGLIETPRQLSRGPLMRSIELIGNHWQFWEGLIAMAEEVRLQNSNVELSSIYIGHKGAFGDLKKLYIKKCHNMGNLASISQDEIQYSFQHEVTCFSKLTILDIESCSELKYLFCNNIAKSLVQLQKLRVFNCESMEAIIVNEGTREGEIITFSNLKSLTIKGCPRLAGFYAQKKNAYSGSTSSMDPSAQYQPFLDREVRFPSLEELKIRSLPYTSVIWGKDCYNDKLRHLRVGKCDKLETVIPQAMMHKVHNLEQIHIYECSSLRTMFLPSVAIDLTHLKELTVKNCEKMTEIIEAGEQLITSDDMLFPELTILELVNLQSLTSVWCCQSGKANTCKVPFRLLQLSSIILESLPALKNFLHGSNFEFHTPALKKVKVDSCVLSTLFTFSMFKKFQLKNLEVRNCELLENIVEDLRGDETCNKIITLSQLTEVALQNLPNLKSFFHNANYEFHMPVIKRVNVYYCGFSDTLFRRSVFKNLKQLKELCVLNCEMLESIFEDARADESADTSDKFITLNKVCTVDIQGLPKLKNIFYGATYQCYMPALKKVTISRCGLSALFTPSVFREFKQLENLNVSHCESLEHIVKEVGVDVTYEMNGKSIISHRLSFVSLEHLPNLKSCFHNANYEFHMPDLRKVKVDCCGLSNALFTRSVFNNLKRLGELSVLNCELLESICEDESPGTSDKIITLNRLSMVNFQGLPKIKSIFYGATFECHMPALDRINIVGCGLSVLFTSSVFREIQQLRKLNVSDCESLEHIVKEVGWKIKAWLYDNMGSRVDYDAPGQSCTRMAYSADGTRLFSCGTSKDGESHIVEWNESEGAVKRSYVGLGKRSMGVVQFDTTKNRFLVAGDEFVIKFWDIDNVNLLTTIDADGGLPASPCIRFSKEGILLAVSTSENGVKILGNAEGLRLVRAVDNRAPDPSRVSGIVAKSPVVGAYGASSLSAVTNIGALERGAPVTAIVPLNGDGRSLPDVNPRITDEMENSKVWKLAEINEHAQLHSLRLPDILLSVRISRLIYTNSGAAILALACNAVHKLWKWQRNERNPSGKATTNVPPQLWQPSSGILMTNDISETKPEDALPCFALSKNDSYVMSASGGKISLFNMMTFKTMTTFMPPPPAATFLAFHPQDNNIIAIGMEDSSIQIYNVRVDEVKSKLKGHQKRVTGLAFSKVLNILVSSGADAQICVWSMDGWEKQASKFVQIPAGRAPNPLGQTRVQFHQDQKHVLVVHETQLAIYEAPKLECIKQWLPRESSGSITDATYSCDSQSIYATLEDGSINVFTATALSLRCWISPAAYLPANPSVRAYPLVITAHPNDPNQFALGLSDGGVHVLEPLESEGRWGTEPPSENGAGPSTNPALASS